MKPKGWLAAVAAVALAAAGLYLWKGRGHDRAPSGAEAGPGPGSAPAPGGPLIANAPPRAPARPDIPPPGAEIAVAIDPDAVLAEVNGVAIKLGDLMVVEPGTRGPQQVDAASLRYLLDRAIDRELVNQAARASGVKLDATQEAHLDEVRHQLDTRAPGVTADLTRTPAYVAFDLRDTEGLMLQTNLVAKSGAPAPYVTSADVDAYYREHQADFPELPVDPTAHEEAWTKIQASIRERLALPASERYQQAVAAFMRDLRARAAIVESDIVTQHR